MCNNTLSKQCIDIIECLQIERIILIPPIATLLAKSPLVDDFKLNLKMLICGAAPLGAVVEDQLRERFPGLICRQGWGQTRT